MKRKMQLVAIGLLWAAISLTAIQATLAQHTHDHGAPEWKKGMVRLNETAWVGDIRLNSGMYHVKHVVEGDRQMLVFRSVAPACRQGLPRVGRKGSGQTGVQRRTGEEIVTQHESNS